MYGNGAGTGMVAYQATRQLRARRRALTAVGAVVLGTATPAARRLPTGTTATRSTATSTVASALFATPTSVGYFCKEIIKQLPLLRKCGSAQQPLYFFDVQKNIKSIIEFDGKTELLYFKEKEMPDS